MKTTFYSALLYSQHAGATLLVCAGAHGPAAKDDAVQLIQSLNLRGELLGIFPGILQSEVADLPFWSRMDVLMTPAARTLDEANAGPLMLDDWSKIDSGYYVASVYPPEELAGKWGPESVVIRFDDAKWWMSSSDIAGQNDFLFLTDAVTAANQSIKEIRERFAELVSPIAS